MAVIKIDLFKVSVVASTWIDDDEWNALTRHEKSVLIKDYVTSRFPRELEYSESRDVEPRDRHYRWSVM